MASRHSDQRLREISEFEPHTITYVFAAVDFGDVTDVNTAIKAPAGFSNGRLIDVAVAVAEIFNAPTTAAFVRIGTSGDADAYAELNMGTAAATDYWNTQDDPDAIINEDVPTSQLEVAFIANTGSLPTGIGDVHITIDWF
jgi:hypothetical protein